MATIRDLLIRIGVRDRAVRSGVSRVTRQLDRLDRKLDGIGAKARTGGLVALAGAAFSLAGALGPAAGGVAGLALSLGAALAPAAALGLALPAVAVAWKTSLAIMSLAVDGLSDTLKAAISGDMKKYQDALKKLPPAARAVASELGGALSGLQRTVQQAFFAPVAAQARGLGARLRGPLQGGAALAAAAFGRLAAQAVIVAREGRSIAFLRGLFRAIAAGADGAGKGVAPLLRGLRDLAGAFLGVVPRIGAGLGGLAAATGRWMSEISRSGKAAAWFTRALYTLTLIGSILRSLGVTVAAVWRAATAGGGNLLATIARGAAAMARWAQSAHGMATLMTFFMKGRDTLSQLWRIAVNLGTALGGIFGSASGQAGSLLDTIERLTAKFAAWTQSSQGNQQLTQTFALLGQVARDLMTILPGVAVVLGQLAKWFSSLPGPVQDVVSKFLAWGIFLGLVAGKIGPLIRGVTMLTGGLIRVGSAAGTAGAALGRAAVAAGRWAGQMAAAAGRAIASAARVAAQFALQAARMAASMAIAAGRIALQWTLMAARAVISAAIMAAQWLIAFWPIALIVALVAGIVIVVIKYWDEIKAFTVKAWGAIKNGVMKAVDFVVGFVKNHWRLLIAIMLGPLGIIIALTTKYWGKIKSGVAAAVRGVLAAAGWLAALPGRVAGWFGSLARAAIGKAIGLVNWMYGLPGRIARALGNTGRLLYNEGKNILIGLWNGLVSMAGRIARWIGDLVRNIIPGPVRRVLGINSPSKVFMGFGVNLGEGLVAGMNSTHRRIAGAAAAMAGAAVPSLAAPGVPGMGAPPGLARAGGTARGDQGALNARAIGDAVADAIRRAGIKVDMDGKAVAEIVTKHTGRASDQRRRTG
ncbi:hypothetical protein [Actinomadura formosensis]|uniref:hypothetical protein n=1 Tax=Actinomadura formosensis TaxID=60706 RepID=UPI003D8DD528